MRETRLDECRLAGLFVRPLQEACRFDRQYISGWRLEVNLAPSRRAGNHLHGPIGIIAPLADGDFTHARVAGREQRRVPAEQALDSQRFGAA